jgi:hypothetical protein
MVEPCKVFSFNVGSIHQLAISSTGNAPKSFNTLSQKVTTVFIIDDSVQGSLTEGEGSLRLTSSLRFRKKKKKIVSV